MYQWAKDFKIVWFFITLGFGACLWLFSHFATRSEAKGIIEEAKATEVRIMKIVDEKDQSVNNRLDRMEAILMRIDGRIDELYKKEK